MADMVMHGRAKEALSRLGGIETPHGSMANFEDGSWVAYGHLSTIVFIESYNWAVGEIDPSIQKMSEDDDPILAHYWAVVDQAPGAADDEWQIRWPDTITRETPGAFPITLMRD